MNVLSQADILGYPSLEKKNNFKNLNSLKESNLPVAVVFAYVMLFELVVFFSEDAFLFYGMIFKLILPVMMFALGYRGIRVALTENRLFYLFTLLTTLLLSWATICTIANYDFLESVASVARLFARLLFFCGLMGVMQLSSAFMWKCILVLVSFGIFSLIQYGCLLIGLTFNTLTENSFGFVGPFGLFGHLMDLRNTYNVPVPLARLYGYWCEPSNASAYLFACFFLSRALLEKGFGKKWYVISWLFIIGGIFCFSNAGYFACGIGLFVGSLFADKNKLKSSRILVVMIGLFMLIFGILGRQYIHDNMKDDALARAIVGVRGIDSEYEFDASAGRLELATVTVENSLSNILGRGIPLDSRNEVLGQGRSASAPIMWLGWTGFFGFALILCRESILFQAALHAIKRNRASAYIAQAWIVVMAQNLSYGSWLNGFYLCLAAFVFSSSLSKSPIYAKRI